MTSVFHKTINVDDLEDGQSTCVDVQGWKIALCKSDGSFFAVINLCTHANSEMVGGRIRRGAISCPLHGALFKLDSGENVGAQYKPLRVFPVRIENDIVEIAIPDEAPPPPTLVPSI